MGKPTYEVEKIFEECGVTDEEILKKIKSENVDQVTFWDLDEGLLEKILEIKSFGQRKKVILRKEELLK